MALRMRGEKVPSTRNCSATIDSPWKDAESTPFRVSRNTSGVVSAETRAIHPWWKNHITDLSSYPCQYSTVP